MSTPATTADTRSDGKRWYVLPTGERLISASTVTGFIAKHGLPVWAAGLAVDAAYDNPEALAAARDTAPCLDPRGEDACGECWPCLRRWLAGRGDAYKETAGDLGTRVHDATEAIDLQQDEGRTFDGDIAAHVAAYRRWVEVFRPEVIATEAVVINRSWRYAGRLDKIVRFPTDAPLPKQLAHLAGKTVVVDVKTGKHVGHVEAIQVTGYAHAETLQLPDGSEEPMPPIDAGLILHLRPDVAQIRAVNTGPAAFAVFASALSLAQSLTGPLGALVSRPATIYRTPKGA